MTCSGKLTFRKRLQEMGLTMEDQSRLGVYISVLHGYRQQNNIENELKSTH